MLLKNVGHTRFSLVPQRMHTTLAAKEEER